MSSLSLLCLSSSQLPKYKGHKFRLFEPGPKPLPLGEENPQEILLIDFQLTSSMLKSVTRIILHIDYVIMYLCKEEDKDNKMIICCTCFMGFMSKILF